MWLVVQALVLILVWFLDHFETREDKEWASMYGELNKRHIKMCENIIHMLV
jgi:hypothetical protein